MLRGEARDGEHFDGFDRQQAGQASRRRCWDRSTPSVGTVDDSSVVVAQGTIGADEFANAMSARCSAECMRSGQHVASPFRGVEVRASERRESGTEAACRRLQEWATMRAQVGVSGMASPSQQRCVVPDRPGYQLCRRSRAMATSCGYCSGRRSVNGADGSIEVVTDVQFLEQQRRSGDATSARSFVWSTRN